MGEYAPDDQRDVHTAKSADWREAEESQQQEQSQSTSRASDDNPQQQAQMGYGNARDADGQMEQSRVNEGASQALPDDDTRPDLRARADAARPLGKA